MPEDAPKHVNINIDGKDYEVPAGMNMVDAAAQCGVEIPHYCYHPKLSVAGNCRMCLVEMGMPMRDRSTGEPVMDENGVQKIGWMPKPAIACASNATQGMHIKTNSELTKGCREGVMEFLLVNHPLDCPICDQAGECRLQEFATDYGRGYSRFVEDKNVKPKRTVLGPRVILDDERCILCSRCVRFCEEIDENPVLGFTQRGSHSTLTCYPGQELDSNYSLNTVDICPVGALTSTDFRFKMRVWFLKPIKSICTESSTGVNTEVWSREGKIYRITPRRNDAVNDTWMTDSGRALYKQVESESRMKNARISGNQVGLADALERAAELIKSGPTAYVASGRASVEEHFLLRKLAEKQPGSVYFVHHSREGDGRLISEDATPNLRGGLVTGLINVLPEERLDGLAEALKSGTVKTVVSFGENLINAGVGPELLKKADLVYLGTHRNDCTDLARVLIPTLTVFEKSGSFINRQFRLQRFMQAVPGLPGLLPDTVVLSRIMSEMVSEKTPDPSMTELWSEIAEAIPSLAGLSFAKIGDLGVELDASPFETLPFCELPGWHFEPKLAEAATASSF